MISLNLEKDWPVYILLGAVIFFFIYAIVVSRRKEGKSKGGQNKES